MRAIRAAEAGLARGLGVEDIAVMHGIDPDLVRDAVAHLRETGRLASVIAVRLQRQRVDAQ